MARILTKLKIHEISSVDRGAGEGVKVVLMKRDDAKDLNTDNTTPDETKRPAGKLDELADALMVAEPQMNRAAAMYFLLHTRSGHQYVSRYNKGYIEKMTFTELLDGWLADQNPQDRRQSARREALLRDQFDAWLRSTREGTTPGPDVHGSANQNRLSETELDGYGSGAQKGADSYRKIVKQIVIDAFADHIIAEGTHMTEEEFVGLVKEDAEAKGQSLGTVLAQNGRLQKAAARCRDGAFARQAQHNIVDVRLRRG
jgi:hypothetical protein